MGQICLAAVTAALLLTGIGCEPDYCSCSYKRGPIYKTGELRSLPHVWCPVGNPENDARIIKLLSDRCIPVVLRPWPPGSSNQKAIWISSPDQEGCANKLLFEAAWRGEITVVVGPGPDDRPPTTQSSAMP